MSPTKYAERGGFTLVELPFGRLRTANEGKRCGFTLIELLVVITIIAVLIALLLPAVSLARRQALVLMCASNQRQIGIGLTSYEVDWGDYPSPGHVSVYIVFESSSPVDNRQNLVDIATGASKDLYFCPLWGGARPEHSMVFGPYSDHFFVHANQRNYVGYNMLFLCDDFAGFTFDWSQSGNSGGGRPIPGDSSSAVLSDINWWSINQASDDWRRPSFSGHSSTRDPTASDGTLVILSSGPFEDSNVLFGDGHVQTRVVLENYVLRLGAGGGFPPRLVY